MNSWRGVRARALVIAAASLGAFAGPLRAQLPAPAASSPSPFRIGGYAGITLSRPNESGRVEIAESSIAAIISGSLTSRVSYLGEFDAVSNSRENYAGRQDDRQLEIARLYGEFAYNDLLRVRVGRFLTPIGQWNEIHAEPLTWTAVRPITTYRSFAKYSTGAMLAGQGAVAGRDAGYALWGAPAIGLREHDDDELQFTGAFGARLAMEAIRGVWIGASGGLLRERRPHSEFDDDSLEAPEDSLEDDDDDERVGRTMAGFDLTVRRAGFELRTEAVWLERGAERPAEQSAFVQLAAPLVKERLYLLGRIEQLSPLGGRTAQLSMVGVHWRAPRRFVVKLEHHDAGSAPRAVANGWFVSVSTFF